MANQMKIRAVSKNGVTEVKVLINHEIEISQRKDAALALVLGRFISELTATYNGMLVLNSKFGQSVSKSLYLAFKFKGGEKDEKVIVSWKENMGDTGTGEASIG